MKTIATILTLAFMALSQATDDPETVHQFKLKDIDGQLVNLQKYEGSVLLIVNVASECGFTPQYAGLEAIYQKYRDRGFEILGFPANNFGGQEPGTNAQIKQFCRVQKGATFPMFSKISVKGGDQDPLFTYLTQEGNPDFTGPVRWNFEKFLISRDGKLLHRFRSPVKPEGDKLTSAIEKALES